MNRRAGFTLMEIMLVISIVAIASSIIGENVNNFFSGQRAQSEALIFVQDIRAARYSAMASQVFHRVIFRTDGMAYRVETYNDTNAVNITTAKTVYSAASWASIIDQGEREIDSEVTVEMPPVPNPFVIFMRPDGLLIASPKDDGEPIPECIATFTYGNSILHVELNAIGVAASREYYEDYN